jgi:hypothetical protein
MEEKDYRLILVVNTQVGLIGLKEIFEEFLSLRLRISLLKKIPLAGHKTVIMLLHSYKITRILPCLARIQYSVTEDA